MARTRSHTKGGSRPQSRSRAAGQRPAKPQAQTRPAAGKPKVNGQAAPPANGATTARSPAAAAKRDAAAYGPPSWLRLTAFVLSLGGLGISIYLTIVHYSTALSLACPETGTVNCEKVITSPESMIFGIPVAVYGLAFFVFMVAINNPLTWRMRIPLVNLARLVSVVVGMGFVLYLIYAELFSIGNICLWCTAVHVITFALFVLVLFSAAVWGVKEETT